MRHLRKGRKFNRTSSHRHALLRSLAMELFEHKKISTTQAKAKELRPYAEKLISKAKNALMREKQGLLVEGQKIDIHNRRIVAKHITRKEVLQELFDTIAPMVEERPGGFTRIIKTGFRRGDGADTAIIELVDWSAPKDGASKTRKKRTQQPKATPKTVRVEEDVDNVEELDEDNIDEVQDVEENIDDIQDVEENIVAEESAIDENNESSDMNSDANIAEETESAEEIQTEAIATEEPLADATTTDAEVAQIDNIAEDNSSEEQKIEEENKEKES